MKCPSCYIELITVSKYASFKDEEGNSHKDWVDNKFCRECEYEKNSYKIPLKEESLLFIEEETCRYCTEYVPPGSSICDTCFDIALDKKLDEDIYAYIN
ncbi:hypothetical protein [Bacillus sp. AFS040349]|uniref:hypothetical protein n=1 Tax=Bacillus sp. AFS040349 TaxID=2033502 RepID=UPI000BFCBF10|nr:hypothetical protein [Bacillus sp. AFS040349]PGT80587.1 hypothetical protein COD11_20975 [Bacillus sp. AFS040349]